MDDTIIEIRRALDAYATAERDHRSAEIDAAACGTRSDYAALELASEQRQRARDAAERALLQLTVTTHDDGWAAGIGALLAQWGVRLRGAYPRPPRRTVKVVDGEVEVEVC